MDFYTDINQDNYNYIPEQSSYCPECQSDYAPSCRPSNPGMNPYPVAMAYVPWQQWQPTYPPERGLARGTIFPDLDLPFHCGRCGK